MKWGLSPFHGPETGVGMNFGFCPPRFRFTLVTISAHTKDSARDMADKKGWGTTVLGWFVVQEDQPGSEAPPDVAPDQPAAPDPSTFFVSPPPAAPSGEVAFDKVFEAAGIAAEERDRVTKTRDLLASLPAGTDSVIKKQIVEASLKAFGVPIDRIIETGAAEIQALEGYIRVGESETQALLRESESRIRQFEEEVGRIRTVMAVRVQEQQAVARACNDQKLRVQQVLEFFGQEAVARVVRESPRLHDPKGPPAGGAGQPA